MPALAAVLAAQEIGRRAPDGHGSHRWTLEGKKRQIYVLGTVGFAYFLSFSPTLSVLLGGVK